jgi:hypothetical protein
LRHIYGSLEAPTESLQNVTTFDQTVFSTAAQWAKEGLLYIPKGCKDTQCRLHVMMHDCGTREKHYLPPATELSSDEQEFAKYAEANNIILLLPRLSSIEKPDNEV